MKKIILMIAVIAIFILIDQATGRKFSFACGWMAAGIYASLGGFFKTKTG